MNYSYKDSLSDSSELFQISFWICVQTITVSTINTEHALQLSLRPDIPENVSTTSFYVYTYFW
jgi:hypothetical protein